MPWPKGKPRSEATKIKLSLCQVGREKKKRDPFERFIEKIKENAKGCWIWQSSVMHAGYGHFSFQQRQWRAHIFSYRLFKGVIPKGLFVLHDCDVKRCVNPFHLYLGDHEDNMRDFRERKPPSPRGKDHHSFGKPSWSKGMKRKDFLLYKRKYPKYRSLRAAP